MCCWMVNIQSSYLSNDRIKEHIRPHITSQDFSFQAKSYGQRSPNTESSDGSIVTKVT